MTSTSLAIGYILTLLVEKGHVIKYDHWQADELCSLMLDSHLTTLKNRQQHESSYKQLCTDSQIAIQPFMELCI